MRLSLNHPRNNNKPYSFVWYITTMDVNHPFTKLSIQKIKKFSKQKIECILVPKRCKKESDKRSIDGIKIRYIDTFQQRTEGEIRQGNWKWRECHGMSVNEEHAKLIGYGVNIFPSLVIDSDIFILNDTIDTFVFNNHKDKQLNRSCFLYLQTIDYVHTWYTSPKSKVVGKKGLRAEKNLPFVHFGGIFFKERLNTREDIISSLKEIPDISVEIKKLKADLRNILS